jgi:hypothetical protein
MIKCGILLLALLALSPACFAQSDQNVPGTNQHDESWDIPGNHYPTIQEQNAEANRIESFREAWSNLPTGGESCEFDGINPIFGGRSLETWDKNLKPTEVSGNRKALDSLEDVLRQLKRGKLGKADRKIAGALKRDSNSAFAWYLRGEILRREDRLAEAQAAFERASTLDNDLIFPVIGKAQLAAKEGEWKRARDLSAEAWPVLFYRLRRKRFRSCTTPASYRQFINDQLLQAVKLNQEAFDHTRSTQAP